jgi:FtsX-like permease family
MANSVTRRTREIGIRVALGARRSTVLWLVTKDTLLLLAIGMAIGIPAALVLARIGRVAALQREAQRSGRDSGSDGAADRRRVLSDLDSRPPRHEGRPDGGSTAYAT